MKMLHFSQAPHWHFERSHRGKVQYSEAGPGNENRRPGLCLHLLKRSAVELGTGLRNSWQQCQDSALLCLGMPKMDIKYVSSAYVRCGLRKGQKNVMYCSCIYRCRLYGMDASLKCRSLEENVLKYTLCFMTCVQISLSYINLGSQMVFNAIRPQHSPRVPLCNSDSWLMGQIPQFCYRKGDIVVLWLLIAGRFYGCILARELVLLARAAHICAPQGFSCAFTETSLEKTF